MRLGISTATCGQLARPAAVRAVAAAAEQVGYSSVWALDRPLTPSESCRAVIDPLAVIAATAAVTSRVRLGASLLVAPEHDPLLLARSLASLDALAEGRLLVSLRPAEPHRAFERLEEALAALSPGHPPVLLGASPPELVAIRADGWDASGLTLDRVVPAWGRIRELAQAAGRDGGSLQLLVRAGIALTDRPLPAGRPPFHGTAEQVADDIDAAGQAGVHEVVLGLLGNAGLDEALDGYARVAEAALLKPAPVTRASR